MSAAQSFGLGTLTGPATVGKTVTVKGEIHSGEALTIEGEVDGTIEMLEHRLTIAQNGKVRAKVKAREIEVLGSMNGQADASDKILIRRGAQFVGEIRSTGIVIEDGGFVKGSVDLSRDDAGKRK
jgi:cytoskeletal protein CcmA (bactofilin family)